MTVEKEETNRGPSWHRPSRKARGASGDPKKDGMGPLRAAWPHPIFFRLALGPTSLPPGTRRPSWHRPSRKARGAEGEPSGLAGSLRSLANIAGSDPSNRMKYSVCPVSKTSMTKAYARIRNTNSLWVLDSFISLQDTVKASLLISPTRTIADTTEIKAERNINEANGHRLLKSASNEARSNSPPQWSTGFCWLKRKYLLFSSSMSISPAKKRSRKTSC
ncbi:hypothetical protein PRIPAC_84763 [Pristionchus pacificus]|uniref:Uncharacterized protein n=1 Tax=Pristionchus pacificus TaxID=54126 RepID=A0A2A6BU10_PRIPA|nr:hypothetical protein PRIPAC_84763 [Pristionchus pacificus]|eukprot:PDM69384.1 hypothetical protein PRIPAC_47686 [Pristionchus pacificus]